MDASVDRMLQLSEGLHSQLAELLGESSQAKSKRELLALAMCNVSMEHWIGQRILMRAGCYTTAMALVRLHFESVVRAIWLHHGAADSWIEKFTAPMEEGQLKEPVLGPDVEAMLKTIAQKAPPFVAGMLGQLKDGTWSAMHSYVHGGVRPIVQSLAGATPYQLVSVLRNGNGLALFAANLAILAQNDMSKRGRIREIQLANLDCLPPISGAPS